MKKSLPIILIGGAIAFFLFKDKLGFGQKSDEQDGENLDQSKTPSEDEKTDAVIDAEKTGGIAQAIQQAKEIAQVVKDAKVLIKTPQGEKNIVVRSGKKKKAKKPQNCSKIKNKKRREKCEKNNAMIIAKSFLPVKV